MSKVVNGLAQIRMSLSVSRGLKLFALIAQFTNKDFVRPALSKLVFPLRKEILF